MTETLTFANYVFDEREFKGEKKQQRIWKRVPRGLVSVDVPLDPKEVAGASGWSISLASSEGQTRVGRDAGLPDPNHNAGLPILFVDEQLYRELPGFLIATVDKFAMLPWRGVAGMP